jgi:hypothetical protein
MEQLQTFHENIRANYLIIYLSASHRYRKERSDTEQMNSYT